MSTSALCNWRFYAHQDTTTSVLPDGCRDFIVATQAGGRVSAFVSTLDSSCYQVQTAAGVLMTGIRLQPGVLLDERSLHRFLVCHHPTELFKGDRLAEFCQHALAVTEALARARHAGSRLAQFDRLVDAAHACQYADQAHLSREMRRWFGATPSSIKQSKQFLAMLGEPGYATPFTAEQISTKNPLGSVT